MLWFGPGSQNRGSGAVRTQFCEPELNGTEFIQDGQRSFRHGFGVEPGLDRVLPSLTHRVALVVIIEQPAQAVCQLGRIIGIDEQAATSRADQFRKRAVSWLYDRDAVRRRLQHIETLGLTVDGHGEDVQALQESDLAGVIGRLDVVEMFK